MLWAGARICPIAACLVCFALASLPLQLTFPTIPYLAPCISVSRVRFSSSFPATATVTSEICTSFT